MMWGERRDLLASEETCLNFRKLQSGTESSVSRLPPVRLSRASDFTAVIHVTVFRDAFKHWSDSFVAVTRGRRRQSIALRDRLWRPGWMKLDPNVCRPEICEVIKCSLHPCWSVLCGPGTPRCVSPCCQGHGLDMRGLLIIVWPLAVLTWRDLVESTQERKERERERESGETERERESGERGGMRLFSYPALWVLFGRWARRLGVQELLRAGVWKR